MKKVISLFLIISLICSTLFFVGCGEEPHVHSYSSWTLVKSADCTHSGLKKKTCSCGEEIVEVIPAKGHYFVGGICVDCGEEE